MNKHKIIAEHKARGKFEAERIINELAEEAAANIVNVIEAKIKSIITIREADLTTSQISYLDGQSNRYKQFLKSFYEED